VLPAGSSFCGSIATKYCNLRETTTPAVGVDLFTSERSEQYFSQFHPSGILLTRIKYFLERQKLVISYVLIATSNLSEIKI